MKYIIFLLTLLFTLNTFSQSRDYRLEPIRYFYDNKNYEECIAISMDMIKDNPSECETPYIYAYNSYKKLWKTRKDKIALCDTLVYILDTRMNNFGETNSLISKKGHYLYSANINRLNDNYTLIDSLKVFYENIEDRDNTNSLYYAKLLTDLYDLQKITIKEYDSTFNTISFTNDKKEEKAKTLYTKRCSENKEWLYLKLAENDTLAGKKLLNVVTNTDSLLSLNKRMYELTGNEYYKSSICYLYYEKGDYNTALKYTTSKTHSIVGNIYYNSYDKYDEFDKNLVMISAYLEYKKDGNVKAMNTCKPYFPSMEEIFIRGHSKGDMVYVGGIVNKKVPLMIR